MLFTLSKPKINGRTAQETKASHACKLELACVSTGDVAVSLVPHPMVDPEEAPHPLPALVPTEVDVCCARVVKIFGRRCPAVGKWWCWCVFVQAREGSRLAPRKSAVRKGGEMKGGQHPTGCIEGIFAHEVLEMWARRHGHRGSGQHTQKHMRKESRLASDWNEKGEERGGHALTHSF